MDYDLIVWLEKIIILLKVTSDESYTQTNFL